MAIPGAGVPGVVVVDPGVLYAARSTPLPSGSFIGRYCSFLAETRPFSRSIRNPFDFPTDPYLNDCCDHITYRVYMIFLRAIATLGACVAAVADIIWACKMVICRRGHEMGLLPNQSPLRHIFLNLWRICALPFGYTPEVMAPPVAAGPAGAPAGAAALPLNGGVPGDILAGFQAQWAADIKERDLFALTPGLNHTPSSGTCPLTSFVFSVRNPGDWATKYFISMIFAGAVYDEPVLRESATWMRKVHTLLLHDPDQRNKAEKHVAMLTLFGELDGPLPPPIPDPDEGDAKKTAESVICSSHLALDYRWNLRADLKTKIMGIHIFLGFDGSFPPGSSVITDPLSHYTNALESFAAQTTHFARAHKQAKERRVTVLADTPYLLGMPKGIQALIAAYWNGFIPVTRTDLLPLTGQ